MENKEQQIREREREEQQIREREREKRERETYIPHRIQARRQKFSEGVRSIRLGVWGPLKAPRSPWVFGAKSCNLAISRHFIQTFGKAFFPSLIFKDFHQILHQLGL